MGKRKVPHSKKKAHQRPEISWPDILVGALVDFLVGTVLILVETLVS